MRCFLTTLFAVFFLFKINGQTAATSHFFKIKPARESALLATGGYLLFHGKILEKKLDGLTVAQLDALLAQPENLSFAEKNYSASARKWSNYLLAPAFGTAATLCFTEAKTRRGFFKNSLVLGETALLSLGSVTMAKNIFKKNRPFIYNDAAPLSEKLAPDARQSFFSGHTCTTAAATFFSAKIWSKSHPNSRQKPLVWAVAAAYPLAVGLLRMRGGKHYFRDVATGYLVGAAIGIGVPALHF